MTTIAYKDGVIAYDSRSTVGGVIYSDDCDKKTERYPNVFFFSGGDEGRPEFMDWFDEWAEHEQSKTHKPCELSAIIVDKHKSVWAGGDYEGAFYRWSIGKHWAIGSGRDFALAAMDAGANAAGAVKAAMLRDVYTGGKIRTFKVK